MISFEDFKKVEIKVGQILSAEKIPDTDKLLKLSVDFGLKPNPIVTPGLGSPNHLITNGLGEKDIRQIVSGIALHFPDANGLVGKRCMFVTNLEPRIIKGYESNGMLFAVSTDDGKFSLLEPNPEIPPGTLAK